MISVTGSLVATVPDEASKAQFATLLDAAVADPSVTVTGYQVDGLNFTLDVAFEMPMPARVT